MKQTILPQYFPTSHPDTEKSPPPPEQELGGVGRLPPPSKSPNLVEDTYMLITHRLIRQHGLISAMIHPEHIEVKDWVKRRVGEVEANLIFNKCL